MSAEPDEHLAEYAAWVREILAVPVALVSLVQADAQVFPGMVGCPNHGRTNAQPR